MTEQKLPTDSPIDTETLKRFEELQTLRIQLADKLLDLEQEKIRTIRAATSVDMEKQKLFESVLVSRGLPPNHPVEVDAKTGLIKLLEPLKAAPEAVLETPSNGVEATA